VTTLAHAHHHDPATALQHGVHGLTKAFTLARRQALQRACLDVEGARGHVQRACRVERAVE
jgi:hypothetical protein